MGATSLFRKAAEVMNKPLGAVTYSNMSTLKIIPASRLPKAAYPELIDMVHQSRKSALDRSRFGFNEVEGEGACATYHLTSPYYFEMLYDGANKRLSPQVFFVIPEEHKTYFIQDTMRILKGSTVKDFPNYDDQFSDCFVAEYQLAKDSVLSLKRGDNNFLENMMRLRDNLDKQEAMLFQVEMTPLGDFWKGMDQEKWEKLRKGIDVTEKNKFVKDIFGVANAVAEEVNSTFDILFGITGGSKVSDIKEIDYMNLSRDSKNKTLGRGFAVRIRAFFCSDYDKANAMANAISVCLREVENDNDGQRLERKLGLKRTTLSRRPTFKSTNPLSRMVLTSEELAGLVSFPMGTLQREMGTESIRTESNGDIPKLMRDANIGKIIIGDSRKGNGFENIYLPELVKGSTDTRARDILCLSWFILAGMGGGKSTFALSIAQQVLKAGHGLIAFDYIRGSKYDNPYAAGIEMLAKDLNLPVRIIDLNLKGNLPCMNFSEIKITDATTIEERLLFADRLAYEVADLIDAYLTQDNKLSDNMKAYVMSVVRIVAVYPNIRLKDIFNAMVTAKVRNEYFNRTLADGIYNEEDDFILIDYMRELEEKDKDRTLAAVKIKLTPFLSDQMVKSMLNAPLETDIDFTKVLDNNEIVVLKFNVEDFTTTSKRDLICVYYMAKIKLAMYYRQNKEQVTHILIDEFHQIPTTMTAMGKFANEIRKYNLNPILIGHYFEQLPEKARHDFMSAGCNITILKKNAQKSFEYIEATKRTGKFTIEDITGMDYDYGGFFSFMGPDSQYHQFILRLPEPPKDKDGNLIIQ
jgi:hypothetical protein